jgi:Prokaryotic homologs of the JAB domain
VALRGRKSSDPREGEAAKGPFRWIHAKASRKLRQGRSTAATDSQKSFYPEVSVRPRPPGNPLSASAKESGSVSGSNGAVKTVDNLLGSSQVVVDLGLVLQIKDGVPEAGLAGRKRGIAINFPKQVRSKRLDADPRQRVLMSEPTFNEVVSSLGMARPEAGGLLLGPKNHRAITHFAMDHDATTTSTTFEVNSTRLNKMMKPFLACSLDLKGIVHSHPGGYDRPSTGDLVYLEKLFRNPKNAGEETFFFPIYCDGALRPYVYLPHGSSAADRVRKAKLILF